MEVYEKSCAALMAVLFSFFPVAPAFSADPPLEERTARKEVGREVHEAVEAIQAYSAEQRDEAIKKGRALLNSLDAEIEQMESRVKRNWNQMSGSAREKAKASLKSIRKQRNDAAEWFGHLKQSSASAWEETKKGFVESYQALHDSFDRASEKF